MSIEKEAGRRRTFAIISHPDAGKTTLTEKLLLYSGAIHLAGSIKSRKAARHTVSDWMKLEQERGISVTSSVLQFEYKGRACNLLDTPGHADFSEDTYRTLAAVDSSIMLIDHAKGVESRTLKLFEVCRMRNLPIVTFMNKLDRDGMDPLGLIDEISSTLNLEVFPMNWPIGMGKNFKGVVDLKTKMVTLYEAEKHGTGVLESKTLPLEEAHKHVDQGTLERALEEIELLEGAGDGYSHEAFLKGEVSPVFWGSAMTNFGVDSLLEFMGTQAASPAARKTEQGDTIEPENERFTGFIFKIQANMNPRHRDRIAFLRVVSGEFERGMDVTIGRSGEKLKLAKPHSFMAQERSIVENAWPGDIVGLYDPGKLRIGDTVASGKPLRFGSIPRFAPAHFGELILKDPLKRKQLDTGLEQLSHEGVIQLFYRPHLGRTNPVLGAVGILQFEVLKERLKNEYNVTAIFQSMNFAAARWVTGPKEAHDWLQERRDYPVYEDRNGNPVLLASSSWAIQYAVENAPGLELHEIEPL